MSAVVDRSGARRQADALLRLNHAATAERARVEQARAQRAADRRAQAGATLGLRPPHLAVLTHTATGATDTQIAARLWLSPETVRSHHKNIYAILGARTRTHAVLIAATAGAIDLLDDQIDTTGLSARELQVLTLIAAGHTNTTAATILAVAPLTVKSHLRRIASHAASGDRTVLCVAAWRAHQIPDQHPHPPGEPMTTTDPSDPAPESAFTPEQQQEIRTTIARMIAERGAPTAVDRMRSA